jgi:hypothetical protein
VLKYRLQSIAQQSGSVEGMKLSKKSVGGYYYGNGGNLELNAYFTQVMSLKRRSI